MISLIIPNYNKSAYLAEMLASTRCQGEVSQIIIVDDASTDRSLEILRDAASGDSRIDLIPLTENHNASFCRNRGLERATAPYVIFLDSDDVLAIHCSRTRLTSAAQFPDHDLWVFPMLVFRDSPDSPLDRWVPRPGNHLLRFLAHRLDWQTMQPLWRREFLVRLGGFDESFRRLQDPELHARALLAGARVKCFPETQPDCFYRAFADDSGDAEQLSARNIEAVLHFYRTFTDRVPIALRPSVTGTLFECLAQHANWARAGKISRATYDRAAGTLIEACGDARQRRVMLSYLTVQRLLPIHAPGVNQLTRMLLGLRH